MSPRYTVELSRWVEGDLEQIAAWIAQGNLRRALSFIQDIRQLMHGIGSGPLRYQLRPEIGEDARMAIAGRYVVLFRVTGTAVRIERVVFGGRDLPGFLEKR